MPQGSCSPHHQPDLEAGGSALPLLSYECAVMSLQEEEEEEEGVPEHPLCCWGMPGAAAGEVFCPKWFCHWKMLIPLSLNRMFLSAPFFGG